MAPEVCLYYVVWCLFKKVRVQQFWACTRLECFSLSLESNKLSKTSLTLLSNELLVRNSDKYKLWDNISDKQNVFLSVWNDC